MAEKREYRLTPDDALTTPFLGDLRASAVALCSVNGYGETNTGGY